MGIMFASVVIGVIIGAILSVLLLLSIFQGDLKNNKGLEDDIVIQHTIVYSDESRSQFKGTDDDFIEMQEIQLQRGLINRIRPYIKCSQEEISGATQITGTLVLKK